MGRKSSRQIAIRDVVRTEPIRTQHELVEALVRRGVECTQATVSRDVAELGLRKIAGGVYVLPEDLYLQRVLSEFAVRAESAQNIVFVACRPGTAPKVASALGDAELGSYLLGSVADERGIMAAARSTEDAQRLLALIHGLAGLAE